MKETCKTIAVRMYFLKLKLKQQTACIGLNSNAYENWTLVITGTEDSTLFGALSDYP